VVVQLPEASCSLETQGLDIDGLTLRWSIVTLPMLELPTAEAAEAFPTVDCSPVSPPTSVLPKLTSRFDRA
jgi:hypothetical protein